MHPIDRTGWGQAAIRRPFPAPLVPLMILLLVAVATLASHAAVLPFFPILLVALFVVGRGFRRAWVRLVGQPAALAGTVDDRPALPPDRIGKEKELLLALERHGEITAARAALETSLSVAAAEEMLSGLASAGHLRVGAQEGRLVYSLWD